MRTLVFLSRVAVLMNVMFLLSMLGYYKMLLVDNNYLNGFIITTGMGIAPILNTILHLFLFALLLRRRTGGVLPAWIILFNLFCFAFQILFFFLT